MKEGCVGFLTVAGLVTWGLVKHPEVIPLLLTVGGILLGIFLFFYIIWYGWVTIRCMFRF